jgi:predicted HAD superfamily Cof-like phosphohydrolase
MPSHLELVKQFQEKFLLPVGATPQALPASLGHTGAATAGLVDCLSAVETMLRQCRRADDQFWGRVQMMVEELRELCEAQVRGDLPGMADALADLEYFVLGTAVMMGLPHDQVFEAVHEANMQKVLCVSADESKRLNKLDVKKPEGWRPPDVAAILSEAAALVHLGEVTEVAAG